MITTGLLQAAADRQLPGRAGWQLTALWDRELKQVLPPQEDSQRFALLSESGELELGGSRARPQSYHSNEVFSPWCQRHHRI